MQFSKMMVHPFTQPELFSHGLKNVKMNFNIFPGQHSHITEPLWSVLETVRNKFPPPTSLKLLEDVAQEWNEISLQAVENLYVV
jgi:hypothetical protein